VYLGLGDDSIKILGSLALVLVRTCDDQCGSYMLCKNTRYGVVLLELWGKNGKTGCLEGCFFSYIHYWLVVGIRIMVV